MFELLTREMKFKQAVVWTNTSKPEKMKNAVLESDSAAYLRGQTSHQERREIVSAFNEGNLRILILADDVAPYGIKTENVNCVIHVDSPDPRNNNEDALEVYERHLSLLQGTDRVIESICFSLRAPKDIKFLRSVRDNHGLTELPADPNNLADDVSEN